MILNKQIEYFRQFLIAAWPHVDNLMENHDWDDDGEFIDEWLQVNWEFLIEREFLGPNKFLLLFGDAKKRITNTQSEANCMIVCKPKNNSFFIDNKTNDFTHNVKLRFEGFLNRVETLYGPSYGLYPPFDFAVLREFENKKFYYVNIEEIDFYIEEIDKFQI